MTDTKSTQSLVRLKDPPSHVFDTLLCINDRGFMTIDRYSDFGQVQDTDMLIYDGFKNKWFRVELDCDFQYADFACCTIDPRTNELLCVVQYECKNQLIAIDFDSDDQEITIKSTLHAPTDPHYYSYGCMVWVDDVLYLFGDKSNNFPVYAVVDTTSWSLQVHPIPHNVGFDTALYLKDTHSILLVGSKRIGPNYRANYTDSCNVVYEFSLENSEFTVSEWMKLSLSQIQFKEMVCTTNGRYVIAIGNNIMVYDMKKKKVKRSKLRLPSSADHVAVGIAANIDHDEALVFGFINRIVASTFKAGDVECVQEIQPLPCYLMDIVVQWVNTDCIHLINADGEHWQVAIKDVLQSQIGEGVIKELQH